MFRLKTLALPMLFTAVLFLAAEAILRITGFQYSHTPLGMRYVMSIAHMGAEQTAYRKTFHIDYTLDAVLLWRPRPNPGITNSQGFLGPEWEETNPANDIRVITLGDSCTVAGEEPYPLVLQRLLARDKMGGGRRWEVLNAGVGSWSSYQGLKLLETRLFRYRPDFVTIYFGWNDHWLAWAAPDKDLSRLLERQWRLRNWINRSRLLQGLLKIATVMRGGPRFSREMPYRVSIDDYEDNLREMVRIVRSVGGEALLMTAPTSLTPRHPVTLILCESTHNFFDPELINQVHSAYNERVRKVSRQTGAPIVDLEREFIKSPNPVELFTDGIHLSVKGHEVTATHLARILNFNQKAGRIP